MRFTASLLTAPLLALVLTTSALADPPAALRLYAAGDYLAAAAHAETQPSAAAHLVAGRALVAAAMTSPQRSDVGDWLARAEAHANEALELDPHSADARLQLAFILGARARRASVPEAIARNFAPRGRRLIQEALEIEPANPVAHALLGAWHLEVLRRGGRTGSALYGARIETGIAQFERARALAPRDGMIALEYAIALLQLDPERYADQVAALLDAAGAQSPRDAFEAHSMRQALRIARVLDEDGPAAARAASRLSFL